MNNNKQRGLLVGVLCFLFLNTSLVQADVIDLVRSSVSVGRLHHYASDVKGFFSQLAQGSNKVNIKNTQDALQVLSVGFQSMAVSPQPAELIVDSSEADDALVKPEVLGQALVYPNPFRQSTTEGAWLGYKLSKSMDIEIHIYDMMAQLILKRSFNSGAIGARKGYNKLVINNSTFTNTVDGHEKLLDGSILSAGVYFYVVLHEGEMLAKGKMAVKP